MVKIGLVFGIVISNFFMFSAGAQSSRGKINTRKLVNEYWTPNKKRYSLIQKRYFVKAHRPMLSVAGGIHINDPYNEGHMGQISLNYFFSERWGLGVNYAQSYLKQNSVVKELKNHPDGGANLNRTKTLMYMGGSLNYSPIYAKMSFLGYKILYYDLILSLQLGQTIYDPAWAQNVESAENPQALTYGLGIIQLFYLNKYISLRFDFTNRWYTAEVLDYNTGEKVTEDRMINDTLLSFGLSLML